MKHIWTISLIGIALCFASATTSRGEPSPDLMNSLFSMRSAALRNSQARTTAGPQKCQTLDHQCHARTRTITAGQGTVSVPEFEHFRCR